MELTFGNVNNVFDGSNPASVHTEENFLWIFRVEDGRLESEKIELSSGDVDWETISASNFAIATADEQINLMRMKNIPRVGLYGVWHQENITEELFEIPERHRLAIWLPETDISDYIENIEIEYSNNTTVSALNGNLENPSFLLSGEDQAIINPGTQIELFLTIGDSEEYPMGVFYVDRTEFNTEDSLMTIDCRSTSGKILKDQTLDENYTFEKKVFRENVVELLNEAGVQNYSVQPAPDVPEPWEYGVQFKPDVSYLDALNNMIEISTNWKVIETLEGKIIAGSVVTFDEIKVNSKYTFNRGSEVFSRNIERDDDEVYSRVCCNYYGEKIEEVYNEETGETELVTVESDIYIYKAVDNDGDWAVPPNKTFYFSIADYTDYADAESVAEEVAARIKSAGTLETFIGPIRPHLIPGDEAEIIGDNGNVLLGIITEIKHYYGKNGLYTQFTVDSGGKKGKPMIKDYIARVEDKSQTKGTTL